VLVKKLAELVDCVDLSVVGLESETTYSCDAGMELGQVDLDCEGQIKSFNQASGPLVLVDLLVAGNSAGVEREASGVGEGSGEAVGKPEEKMSGEGEKDDMSLGKE